MSYKATIKDSKLKCYTASIDIHDENGNYICGYYVTELEDKRKKDLK